MFMPEKTNSTLTLEKESLIANKKPDCTIEKFQTINEKQTTTPILVIEFKSYTRDRFEEALKQTVEHLGALMDDEYSIDVYIVIMRHTKIGVFEFHANTEDVEETVESLWGCTSLTLPLTLDKQQKVVLQNHPDDLLRVYHDTEK